MAVKCLVLTNRFGFEASSVSFGYGNSGVELTLTNNNSALLGGAVVYLSYKKLKAHFTGDNNNLAYNVDHTEWYGLLEKTRNWILAEFSKNHTSDTAFTLNLMQFENEQRIPLTPDSGDLFVPNHEAKLEPR